MITNIIFLRGASHWSGSGRPGNGNYTPTRESDTTFRLRWGPKLPAFGLPGRGKTLLVAALGYELITWHQL